MSKFVLIGFVGFFGFFGFFGMVTLQVECRAAYETRYDDVDLDKILESRRLVQGYIKCVMGDGPCTPDGSYLANVFPEAINNGCAECSEKQRIGAKKAIQKIQADYPEEWQPLAAKWDPDNTKINKLLSQ